MHYLVDQLTIYAPIGMLRDQIELVDTPGLDDTEQFRVRLTEQLVGDVDAILFLTTSGASYGQSDKDFLIRQLRRRQIKHLQIIATKADETYANAVRDAQENDDTPPTYEEFRAKEKSRIRGEIKETLDELLKSNQLSDEEGYYYMEQLEDVPIHLISIPFHNEGKLEHGGIDAVRDGLYKVLSSSHRFEQSRKTLTEHLAICLNRLRDHYHERFTAIGSEYDPKKIKTEIETIRSALDERLSFFDDEAGKHIEELKLEQKAFASLLPTYLQNISFQAREVLNDVEKLDIGRHWKTRRVGNWGHLHDLQAKIADQIFPTVEIRLNELRKQFDGFIRHLSSRVVTFQDRLRETEDAHRLTGLEPMALAESLGPILEDITKKFTGLSEIERNGIVSRLDDFVTEEVSNRLDKARTDVASVWGTGTTWRQSEEVQKYYKKISKLLADALEQHLQERFKSFAEAILEHARSVAPAIRRHTLTQVEQRLKAIESSKALSTAEEKKRVTKYLLDMRDMAVNFAAESQGSTEVNDEQLREERLANSNQSQPSTTGLVPKRYEIRDGQTGFTYESIFRPYLDDAERIVVEDPYIRLGYQVENFARFCALAVRLGAAKEIELITGSTFGENTDDADSRLETLRRDLVTRNVQFNFRRMEKLHDREFRLSNGWIIKIGRGLDIYYPPDTRVSVEAQEFSLRKCKQTKIEIFRE